RCGRVRQKPKRTRKQLARITAGGGQQPYGLRQENAKTRKRENANRKGIGRPFPQNSGRTSRFRPFAISRSLRSFPHPRRHPLRTGDMLWLSAEAARLLPPAPRERRASRRRFPPSRG